MAQLANPINLGQMQVLVRNATISWNKGNELAYQDALEVRSLFGERKATQYTEEYQGGPATSGFSSKTGDGEDYKLVSGNMGDALTLTQIKRTARIILTEDLTDFSKYPEVNRQMQDVGGYLWRGYALDLSHRFTFSGDTSYVDRDGETVSTLGGDGAAMVADTHTMNGGGTFDNKMTSRLSDTALEDAEDMGAAVIDHNNNIAMMKYTILATGVHAATRNMAKRLYAQQTTIGNTTNYTSDMNVYAGQYRHVVIPYLDTTALGNRNTAKSRWWFLINPTWAQNNLISSVYTWPMVERPSFDKDNNNVQFKGKMRYDMGHMDGSGIIGSHAV